jgi:hypothetical protein
MKRNSTTAMFLELNEFAGYCAVLTPIVSLVFVVLALLGIISWIAVMLVSSWGLACFFYCEWFGRHYRGWSKPMAN